MNIVILDGQTTNPGDISWHPIEKLGNLKVYSFTKAEDILPNAREAQIIITNKTKLDGEILSQLSELRCICLLATGYNNIDIDFCKKAGIQVFNAIGYSSPSVAQHVFACILHMIHRMDVHNESVRNNHWSNQPHFSYQLTRLEELKDKTLGIYGFGKIGRKVHEIGQAFGMHTIALHKHPERDRMDAVQFVDQKKLFAESDFLTLHAPLSADNENFINKNTLALMKKSARLINTGRGGLVNEADLYEALASNQIKGAALDVLDQEPPLANHKLYDLKNCYITPHQAWVSKESRVRLVEIVATNIRDFQIGNFANSLT